MEFFGDTIESMREFDPETQRSTAEIREAVVLPVREVMINDQGIERFKKRFPVTSNVHGLSTQNTIDQIQQGVLPPGGEFLAPFFYEMESLFHFLPQNSLFALIEPDDLKTDLEEQGRKREEGRQEEVEEGRALPEVAELYLDQKGVEAGLSNFPVLNLRLLGTGAGFRHGHEILVLAQRPPHEAGRAGTTRAGTEAR